MIEYQPIIFIERCPLASMLFPIPPSEKKKAIQYLIEKIPAKTLEEVAMDMKENGSDWWVVHHHGFGMAVRNLLREGGFDWNSIDLDEVWIELVEKAVKKKIDK